MAPTIMRQCDRVYCKPPYSNVNPCHSVIVTLHLKGGDVEGRVGRVLNLVCEISKNIAFANLREEYINVDLRPKAEDVE